MAPRDPNQTARSINNTTKPAASTSNAGSVTNPNSALPVTALSILNGMFSTLSNDSKFSNLSLSKDNWPKWSQKIKQVLEMLELDEYLYGLIIEPIAAVDAVSFRNWKGNNKKLIGVLKVYVEDSEVAYLATDNAQKAWNNLVDHHEK